jgi:serpin B
MTYAGARENTAAQMARALCFDLDPERLHPACTVLQAALHEAAAGGEIQIAIANTLWPQEKHPFLDAFLSLLRRHYGVEVTPLNYGRPEEARHTINAWVEEHTQHKIRDMIPRGVLDSMTRLVLVNGIYFKGDWASQFDPERTRYAPFWIAPGEETQVPMMGQAGAFGYRKEDDLQVLELPYAGGTLSMIVLLPRERDGLPALEARLTAEHLAQWTANLPSTEVSVQLPRFKITFSCRLESILQAMGMRDAFGDAADFSGMDGTTALYLSAALHKAYIATDEQGTEAAAATAAIVTFKAIPVLPSFRADHPFLFVIRENRTGSLLFVGRVTDPSEGLDDPARDARAARPKGMGQVMAEMLRK